MSYAYAAVLQCPCGRREGEMVRAESDQMLIEYLSLDLFHSHADMGRAVLVEVRRADAMHRHVATSYDEVWRDCEHLIGMHILPRA